MKHTFIIFLFFFNILNARTIHVLHIVHSQPDLSEMYEDLKQALEGEVAKMAKALNANTQEYLVARDCCSSIPYLQSVVLRQMNVFPDDVILVFIFSHGSHRTKDSLDNYPSLTFARQQGDESTPTLDYSLLLNELLLKKPATIMTLAYTCNKLPRQTAPLSQRISIQTDSLVAYSKMKNPAIYEQLFRAEKDSVRVVHFFSAQKGGHTNLGEGLSGMLSPFITIEHFTNYGLVDKTTWENLLYYMALRYASKGTNNCPLVEKVMYCLEEKSPSEVAFRKKGWSINLCQ